MRKLFGRFGRSSLSLLYDEARLPAVIRRSLNLILLGNIFGNLHGIMCWVISSAICTALSAAAEPPP